MKKRKAPLAPKIIPASPPLSVVAAAAADSNGEDDIRGRKRRPRTHYIFLVLGNNSVKRGKKRRSQICFMIDSFPLELF